MINAILRFSVERRFLTLSLILVLVGVGVWSFQRLPIDAVPDITNVQVQINTEAPGYSPLEAEQRITFPVETALYGLPNLSYTRSLSRYGLSQVTVVFEEGTDIYFARNLINERLGAIKSALPPGLEPEMGPIATGLGEIFMYTVEALPGRSSGWQSAGRYGTAGDPGLDHQTPVGPGARRDRGQHHWRLRQAVPRHAVAPTVAGVRHHGG